MPWPGVTDFTDAIYTPNLCFEDLELGQGRPSYHPRSGRPLVYSGNFASMYPLMCSSRKIGVRCFTREVKDHQYRYGQLTEYLKRERPHGFVEVEYKPRGIRIRGDWYPIVKMEWVEGSSLDKYVLKAATDPAVIRRLAERWLERAKDLQKRDIAHNDLQHGNVMVQDNGSLNLVDYDGIFLPQYRGQDSPEMGHPNFQHPKRTPKDYGEYVDNFPALVIYVSLLAIAVDASLMSRFYNDDNLILKRSDYANPTNSQCFQALKNSPDATVRKLAAELEKYCSAPVAQVPTLEQILNPAAPKAPAAPSSSYRDMLRQPTPTPSPSPSPSSSRPRPQQAPQGPALAIDLTALLQYVVSLNQQELKTFAGQPFVIKQTGPEIRISLQNGAEREIRRSDVEAFLTRYNQTQSWHSQDYGNLTSGTVAYCFAILRNYIDKNLLPNTVSELNNTVSELERVSSDLQVAQQQALEANDKFKEAQVKIQELQRKLSADIDSARRELQAARSELRDSVILCPLCKRENLGTSIYCENVQCLAELHSGQRSCRQCKQSIPARGNYCPQCGTRH